MNIKEKAKEITGTLPAVYLVMKDSKTPLITKILAAVTVGYALSPIDLVPDFIPVLGYLDDVILLPVLITLTIKTIPKEIWEKNVSEAKNLWKNNKPKVWYCALPVILFWVLILYVILNKL